MLRIVIRKKRRVEMAEQRIASQVYSGLTNLQKVQLYNKMALESPSAYCYHEGDTYVLEKATNLTLSYGVVENHILQDSLATSDFFIAYGVTVLGVTDLVSLKRYLGWLHDKYPQKVIPYQLELKVLKSRLSALANAGIVRVFSIKSVKEKKGNFYSISDVGARAVKRRLDIDALAYDAWPLVDCEHKVYRRLVTSQIATHIMKSAKVNLRPNFYSELYDKNRGAKFSVYAQMQYEDNVNGVAGKSLLVIEPVSFVTNPNIKTEMEMEQDIKDRINALAMKVSTWLDDDKSKVHYNDVIVVFVVDDFSAMSRIINIIQDAPMKLIEHVLFTTEKLLATNNGNLSRSFYCINYKETQDGLRASLEIDNSHAELFGVDDGSSIKLSCKDLCRMGYADINDEGTLEKVKVS